VALPVDIVVAEDSQAGRELWQQLENELAAATPTAPFRVSVAQTASELLEVLARRDQADRRPHLVLIDLFLPIRPDSSGRKPEPSGSTPARVAVWLARHIRRSGNATSRLVLWTNNVSANELNNAYAFCNLEVDGARIGDYVIDKATDVGSQVATILQLLGSAPASMAWTPPIPTRHITPAPRAILPYLEAGVRPSVVAEALVVSKKTVDGYKEILRSELAIDGTEHELSVAIVAAARAAGLAWIPLVYHDDERDPLKQLAR
jgi:CheY-like chemotaxis protein